MNNPYRFLKIFNISDGFLRSFYEDELEGLEIIENYENKSLAMNTANVTILPKNDVGVIFDRTLPMVIYKDNAEYAQFFIDNYTTNAKQTVYKITANDYVGLLEHQTFLGGFYTNATLNSIVAEILSGYKYYVTNSTIGNRRLTGWIPITTKREALRQVVFAAGGMINNSRADAIIVESFPTTVRNVIEDSNILSFSNTLSQATTQINLTTHTYTLDNQISELYNSTLNGTEYLTFNTPHKNYSISGGTILSSGANYCVIQGTGSNVVLNGYEYIDTSAVLSKTNSYASSSALEKIDSYETYLTWNNESLLNSLKFVKSKIKARIIMNETYNELNQSIVTINGINCFLTNFNHQPQQNKVVAQVEGEVYYG